MRGERFSIGLSHASGARAGLRRGRFRALSAFDALDGEIGGVHQIRVLGAKQRLEVLDGLPRTDAPEGFYDRAASSRAATLEKGIQVFRFDFEQIRGGLRMLSPVEFLEDRLQEFPSAEPIQGEGLSQLDAPISLLQAQSRDALNVGRVTEPRQTLGGEATPSRKRLG